jgi:hypothetical protein
MSSGRPGGIRHDESHVAMDDERTIYYTLSGLGRKVLDAELDR